MPKYKNTKHKNPFREDRPKPPFPWITVILAVLIIAAIVLGSVLIYNRYGTKVRNFTTDAPGVNVYDPRSGISYEYSVLNSYQAAKLGELYGKCGEFSFYRIDGINPETMIFASMGEGDDEIPYGIFCSSDYVFPDPRDFEVNIATIHQTEIHTVALGTIEEADAKLAMSIILNNESSDRPSGIIYDDIYEIYFYSEKYDYLCYVIKFMATESGDRYLCDEAMGRYVKLTDDQLAKYF